MDIVYTDQALDSTECINSIYAEPLRDFEEQIALQEKKYPLSEREKLFADTLHMILQMLDHTTYLAALKELNR